MSDPLTQLDCTFSSGRIAWTPNDVCSPVKDLEHSGHVRGLGSDQSHLVEIPRQRLRDFEYDWLKKTQSTKK